MYLPIISQQHTLTIRVARIGSFRFFSKKQSRVVHIILYQVAHESFSVWPNQRPPSPPLSFFQVPSTGHLACSGNTGRTETV